MLARAEILLNNRAKHSTDPRVLRAKLIASEATEVFDALIARDSVALLDGICDLEYVTIGTGTTFDLPVEEGFAEVHRSNMTKDPNDGVSTHSGNRGKGLNYSPPDLRRVIAARAEARATPLF